MKVLIAIIASMLTVTAHASPKQTLSHDTLRLVNDSNIMLVDLTACFDAQRTLREQQSLRVKQGGYEYSFKNLFPNLRFPKFSAEDSTKLHSLNSLLNKIQYNQKTQKYLHFQCKPFGGTKNDIILEVFVESISVERMQELIDDIHQKWLEEENKKSQKVSKILEL